MAEAAKIKGSVMQGPRDWLRTAYGTEAYQSALGRISAEERLVVDGAIYAANWYPIELWDRFLSAMADEASTRRGESREVFNRRFMEETGSVIVRGVYRFVMGLMSPESVVEKASVIYNRAYSQGRCQLVQNVPGRMVARYVDGSPAFRNNLGNHFLSGFMFALRNQGAQDVQGSVSKDEVVDDKLVYEVTVTYRPK